MVNLKQIQLIGFKSFADKTKLVMSDGITCIVGPNGCGKSNIADAIRWVLGERSAKNLRGQQMVDVIFNGTEKRKELDYAEVTLVFDNTSRYFDIETNTVEMTRRLYRSGENEYYLNRRKTKQKILVSLLHGAGAAKEGYSIISQGRIAQIIQWSPTERRTIFEEATGVITFKDRKYETEKKLQQSCENLAIFNNTLADLESDLEPLKKKADNARKYQELHTKLRYHEINTFINRTESAESDHKKLTSVRDELVVKSENIKKSLEELTQVQQNLRELLRQADNDLSELNERKLDVTLGLEKSNSQSKIYNEKADNIDDKIKNIERSIEINNDTISMSKRNIAREERNKTNNQNRLSSLAKDIDTLKTEISELNAKLNAYEIETGESRKKAMEALKKLGDLKGDMASLNTQQEFLKNRIGEMMGDKQHFIDLKNEAEEDLKNLIATKQKLSDLVGNEDELIDKATKKVSDAVAALNQIINNIQTSQITIAEIKATLSVAIDVRDKYTGYIRATQEILKASRTNYDLSKKIAGLISEVVSIKSPEFEVAIETAFGAAMQNIITATREDARDIIQYARLNRIGTITCLPIDGMQPRYEGQNIVAAKREHGAVGFAIDLVKFDRKFENVIHNLLGNTLIVENLNVGTQISKHYPRQFRIITLEGDVIATSGAMTGGSRKENKSNLFGNERIIQECESKLETSRNYLQNAQVRKTKFEEQKVVAETEFEDLRKQISSAREELAVLTERQNGFTQDIVKHDKEILACDTSINLLKDRLTKLENSMLGIDEQSDELSKNSDADNEKAQKEYEANKKLRDEKTEELGNANIEYNLADAAIKTAVEKIATLNVEIEKLQAKNDGDAVTIKSLKVESEGLRTLALHAALTSSERKSVDEIDSEINKIVEKKNDYNTKQDTLDEDRSGLMTENEKLQRQINEKERALQKLDDELENIRARIEAEYGLSYAKCAHEKDENYDMSQSTVSIANYTRQIKALGNVDITSISEYETKNLRHQTMLEEKRDLVEAMENIKKALDEITSEMTRLFNDGFNKINENFKALFKQIFGGGRAELVLEQCDDPLEAGVSIKACPPGKKVDKLLSLSGGEQTLVSLAILFGIIQLRAMPFVLLDEVEAALDDENIRRYADFLGKFSQETQFIVITHRKPTMEACDTLFGVTMEEKGVSKIVSVKLSEVESKLGGDTVEEGPKKS